MLLTDARLTRPDPAPVPGRSDDRLYDVVEERFERLMRDHPGAATFLGIHDYDDRLGDGSRDVVLQELAADKAHLGAVEAIDPAELSAEAAFERDLEIHNVRRDLFDLEVFRLWERRSTAMDVVGDSLFALFARDFAPLPDRLRSIIGRLGDVPRYLESHRTRAAVPQVRLWQQLELEAAADLPSLFTELEAAGQGVLDDGERQALAAAVERAREAVEGHAGWLRMTLDEAVDDWALGRETYDEMIRLRALGDLGTDEILEIGLEQLAHHKAARVEAARRIDAWVDEPTVVDRIKRDHPATFEAALDAYRDVMVRARRFLVEHDIVTVPPDERIEVIATPEYLRNVIPFAAYFEPPKFDSAPQGIYLVTPSVGNDPNAMREHNYSSISNTSIHEAYPGHHLQLSVAVRHPSLTRLVTDAPEFVEGWGMYSEEMMREEGFDAAPNFLLNVHTDAIWRACRIVLDIRLHRGEISTDDAIAWLIEQTSFEHANARAEVLRYTYTPGYQLSYLLGKVLLLRLRDEERRRLGDAFSLRAFHDGLLRNGSIPISFHRRLLAGAPS